MRDVRTIASVADEIVPKPMVALSSLQMHAHRIGKMCIEMMKKKQNKNYLSHSGHRKFNEKCNEIK